MPFTPPIPNLVIDHHPMIAAIGDAIKTDSRIVADGAYVDQGVAAPVAAADRLKPRISLATPSVVPDRFYGDNALRMLLDIACTTQGRDTSVTDALAVVVQDVVLNHLSAPAGYSLWDVTVLGVIERDPPPIADQIVRVRVVNTRIWFEKN